MDAEPQGWGEYGAEGEIGVDSEIPDAKLTTPERAGCEKPAKSDMNYIIQSRALFCGGGATKGLSVPGNFSASPSLKRFLFLR